MTWARRWYFQPDGLLDDASPDAGAPLEEDLVMIGSGSVDLWVMSTAATDLEVNLTEIRPDGMRSVRDG